MYVRFGLPLLATLLIVGGCDRVGEPKVYEPPPTPADRLDTRTFAVEHISPEQATNLVRPYVFADRPLAPGAMSYSSGVEAISVRETPDNLDKIARMLEQFDVAASRPRSYRLHFQVVVGNGAESTDDRLALVERELRKVFRFDGYSLIGEGHVAVSGGTFELQIATNASEPLEPSEKWRMHIVGRVYGKEGDEAMSLTITDLPPGMSVSRRRTGKVETRLGFRPGQTLVLGSMPSQNQTVFVVVHVAEAEEAQPA